MVNLILSGQLSSPIALVVLELSELVVIVNLKLVHSVEVSLATLFRLLLLLSLKLSVNFIFSLLLLYILFLLAFLPFELF